MNAADLPTREITIRSFTNSMLDGVWISMLDGVWIEGFDNQTQRKVCLYSDRCVIDISDRACDLGFLTEFIRPCHKADLRGEYRNSTRTFLDFMESVSNIDEGAAILCVALEELGWKALSNLYFKRFCSAEPIPPAKNETPHTAESAETHLPPTKNETSAMPEVPTRKSTYVEIPWNIHTSPHQKNEIQKIFEKPIDVTACGV